MCNTVHISGFTVQGGRIHNIIFNKNIKKKLIVILIYFSDMWILFRPMGVLAPQVCMSSFTGFPINISANDSIWYIGIFPYIQLLDKFIHEIMQWGIFRDQEFFKIYPQKHINVQCTVHTAQCHKCAGLPNLHSPSTLSLYLNYPKGPLNPLIWARGGPI